MSMTTELVDRLRDGAHSIEDYYEEQNEESKLLKEAADTIQLLSEKLRSSQMKPCEDIKDALHIAQTDRDKWKARAQKLAKIIDIRDCDIDEYEQQPCEDCISRQAALDTFGLSEKSRKYGGDHSGYDTIMLYEVQDALEALPSVQPEPFINKPCVSEQACHEDKMKVLDKIRAEIAAKCCITVGRECDGAITLHDVFEIIDKYKVESEDADG